MDELHDIFFHTNQRALMAEIEKTLSEERLIDFVKALWPFVEPARPLIPGWPLDAICEHLEAVTNGQIKNLLISVPPGFMKSLLTNVFWPAWEWGPRGFASLRYMCVSYSQGLTVRDNVRFRNVISSDLYQELWGDRFSPSKDQFSLIKVGNDHTGWKLATSVGGIGTGERADRIICDDPNNIKEAESETIRASTNQWFCEVLPTRKNSAEDSVTIVIQQRTHEDDVTGVILEREMPYVHLMIPMEYDSSRHCFTEIGWNDPRGLDEDGERLQGAALDGAEGELAWPDRFSAKVVDELKRTLGPYAACTPAESPVLMADLSMKPISEVRPGDSVVGFPSYGNGRRRGPVRPRRRLMPTSVKAVHVMTGMVEKITLASGRTVRATPDHRWYTGRSEWRRKEYNQIAVGSSLMRVADPSPRRIETEEDVRQAAWLEGFYDGEGTVTGNGGQIMICQGAGRNLPLCEKLERALAHFGFEYNVYRYQKRTHEMRHYTMRGGIEMKQKWLSLIQSNKWRDRIIKTTYDQGARFILEEDKVVKIEPDGVENVYALETESGNYIVWGYASSNSGQLQQAPSPRGGGIFRRDWWEPWPPPDHPEFSRYKREFPPFEYIVASLDTAYGEKQENDFTAMTVWGIFSQSGTLRMPPRLMTDDQTGALRIQDARQPKLMLMTAWKKRVPIAGPPEQIPGGISQEEWNSKGMRELRTEQWGLLEWVLDTCQRWKVDDLLIEAKAVGMSVAQELRRLLADVPFGVHLINPDRDKVAQAYSVVHFFANGVIYAPLERVFSQMVIKECADFPKAKHDDLVDSTCQAIRFISERGLLVRKSEAEADIEDRLQMKKPMAALYPC